MTAVIILIVIAGLLWLIGQGVLLAMVWSQQQRLHIRFDQLVRTAGITINPAAQVAPAVPRVGRAGALTPADVTAQPQEPDRDDETGSSNEAPRQVPERGERIPFPPPLRKQSPVPSAREPLPVPDFPTAKPESIRDASSAQAVRVPHDDSVHGGVSAEESERSDGTSGLPSGSLLPDFEMRTLDGGQFRRSQLEGTRAVLVFLATDSPGSAAVLESIRSPQVRKRSLPDLVLVIDGLVEPERLRQWLGRLPKRVTVLIQEETELASVLRVPGTPAAYVLDDALQTRGGLRTGARAVLEALGVATAQMTATARRSTSLSPHQRVSQRSYHGLQVGEQAPELSLSLSGGGIWERTSDRPKLLIFWDTSCPPCNAMSDALIEAAESWTGFDAVLISRGGTPHGDAIDRLRDHLPVAHQQGFGVARQFRLLEAPAAIALTSDGVIARPPAIGAAAVLALAQELQDRASRPSAPRQERKAP